MMLFLNPSNVKAQKAIQKLEALTADEFEDDLFAMQPVQELTEKPVQKQISEGPQTPQSTADKIKGIERFVSLADAYIVRNDLERAEVTLQKALQEFGSRPEILSRLDLLLSRQEGSEDSEEPEKIQPVAHREQLSVERTLLVLNAVLQNIRQIRTQRLTTGEAIVHSP
jgi:hypothetical protein